MRTRDRAIVVVVVAIVLFVAFLRTAAHPPASPAAGAPAEVPQAPGPQTSTRVPRIVDLGAGRCIPCRKMAPILAELRAEYAGRADVIFIDVWESPELADGYRFRAIPTQIFYDRHGREVWRHEGFLDKPEIVAQFRALGVE